MNFPYTGNKDRILHQIEEDRAMAGEDIRDKVSISHADVTKLNFIISSPPWVFRKHFRQGLRSHVMEILDPGEVETEQSGTIIEGTRWFPAAIPRHIFRIFRTRLQSLEEAWAEIERVKLVSHYLAPQFMAHSTECIMEYHGPNGSELMLCGFQEYIKGEIFDPWTILDTTAYLQTTYASMCKGELTKHLSKDEWGVEAREKGLLFVDKIKTMIIDVGIIPDLAGVGNLIMTAKGELCLVDINNISAVSGDAEIVLDEKDYPVCDKSVEALSLIEEKICGQTIDMNEKLYKLFLNPERKAMVEEKVQKFWKKGRV